MGQAEHHYRAEDVWRVLTKARRLKSWPITFGPALISWCRRVLSKSQAGAQSACNECLIVQSSEVSQATIHRSVTFQEMDWMEAMEANAMGMEAVSKKDALGIS